MPGSFCATRRYSAAAARPRNPETKQREPDGIWEFDPAGAMRALHELDEHLRALREEETEDGTLSLEEWLARQEGASAL